MEKAIYKTIRKQGKSYTILDKAQVLANIYNYNKKLGANY